MTTGEMQYFHARTRFAAAELSRRAKTWGDQLKENAAFSRANIGKKNGIVPCLILRSIYRW
jgi:sulfite exporter TauE/SafE